MYKNIYIVSTSQSSNLTTKLESRYAAKLRRANELTKISAITALHVLSLAEKSGLSFNKEKTGLFVSTITGPINDNFGFLDSIQANGEGFGSPTLFSHSVTSAVAGYLTMILECTGPVLSTTSFAWPFIEALQSAWISLQTSDLEYAIVVYVQEQVKMLQEAHELLCPKKGDNKEFQITETVAWLLTCKDHVNQNFPSLININVELYNHDPDDLICGKCFMTFSDGKWLESNRSQHAKNLTFWLDALKNNPNQKKIWQGKSSLGQTSVTIDFHE